MKKYVGTTRNGSTIMVEADLGANNYVWSCENLIEVDRNGNVVFNSFGSVSPTFCRKVIRDLDLQQVEKFDFE